MWSFCHRALLSYSHTRARVQCTWQWLFTNTANLKCWCMMSCGSSCARQHTPPHTPAHRWEPPKVEPYGGCHLLHQHLSPGSCTKNETSTSPLLSSTMPPLWGVSDQPAMIIQYQETLPVLRCVPAKQPEAWQKLWNWKRKYLKIRVFFVCFDNLSIWWIEWEIAWAVQRKLGVSKILHHGSQYDCKTNAFHLEICFFFSHTHNIF